MKLFTIVFLVLVILEEYHCDPCLDWLFGFNSKTSIRGGSKHKHGYGQRRPTYAQYTPPESRSYVTSRPRYHPEYTHNSFPSYHQNGMGYGPLNHPEPAPHFTHHGRPFGATYNIPFGRRGQNGTPHRTPYGWYGGFKKPQYQIPLGGTAQQTPTGSPSGKKNSTPNATPVEVETSLETGDGKPQRKQFFVTPDGIKETPAEHLLRNAST